MADRMKKYSISNFGVNRSAIVPLIIPIRWVNPGSGPFSTFIAACYLSIDNRNRRYKIVPL